MRRLIAPLIMICALTAGCDRFYIAQIAIDPRASGAAVARASDETEVQVYAAAREFATKQQFSCAASLRPLYLLECKHDVISFDLLKRNDIYDITLGQLWGNTQRFCNLQGHLFELFSQRIDGGQMKMSTNYPCGRKSYP